MRARPPLESSLVERIRSAARKRGWLVEKTHGNAFQAGWPDLMVARPALPETLFERTGCVVRLGSACAFVQWVEVKRPTGRLTRAQRVRFASWEEHGVGVWVMTGPDELGLLDRPPNWREWA